MATYTLFSASYGSNYANLRVRILEAATGNPAIIMASATSGLLSIYGNTVTDSSGNLAVYLDSAKTFQVWNNQFQLVSSGSSLAIEVKKTAAQLSAAPTLSDIGLGQGATFFLDTNPTAQYRISADTTQFVLTTGSGSGSATLAGLTDITSYDLGTNNTSVAAIKTTATSGSIAASRLPAFTGDAASSAGTSALTLATVNGGPVSNSFVKVTTIGKGLVTASTAVGSSDITTALGYTPPSTVAGRTGAVVLAPADISGLGIPTAMSTGHSFVNADNGNHVIASSNPNYVLNTGLVPGWGVSVRGAFTYTGTATVTDIRTTTGNALAFFMQTSTDGSGSTYDLGGTK